MRRLIENQLNNWKQKPSGKSLLIRGARQVGKTYSIRNLGKSFKYFLEVNFELESEVHKFFQSDLDPDVICTNLSAYYNIPVKDGETLLFLDEIQACPPAITSLWSFHEKRPGLHVAAAGSLLEFTIKDLPSFGLGRIESLYMYPLSFDEFLLALGQDALFEVKQQASPSNPLNPALHNKLVNILKQFLLTGGLPEAVKTFVETSDLQEVQVVLDQLITGLEDDFSKYKKHVPVSRIREVFNSIVYQSGNKFILSKATLSANHKQINETLQLLEMAGLAYKVHHTSANGLPLGAAVSPNKFKVILFDHGIFQRILGLNLSEHLLADDFSTINKGNLTEQYVGMEFVKNFSPYGKPRLYYWHREKRGSNAEVDYLLQLNTNIIPVEVKSGTQGKMQSLYLFMKEKNIPAGIRISLENFSHYNSIHVFPLYGVENIFNHFT
ncbi:MAG: ATP-binding protein [Chlorobi bacterium]|nr:ATP-binding protein [Chlorobiota bacterium]